MPYDNTGTFSPVLGAENAVPGKIIASATWNAIFTDIALALTQLGQGQLVNIPRKIVASGDITVGNTDNLILIQASVANINLPLAANKTSPVTIIGNATGIFGSHPSSVKPNGTETIDGVNLPTVLNQNYGSITLFPVTGGWVTK